MAIETQTTQLSPLLQQRLAEHRAEVARLRAELGDPLEGLAAFAREHFTEAAMRETLREVLDGRDSIWNDEEEDFQDDDDLDG